MFYFSHDNVLTTTLMKVLVLEPMILFSCPRRSNTRTTLEENNIWQLFSQALFVDHYHEVKVNLIHFCHDDFAMSY